MTELWLVIWLGVRDCCWLGGTRRELCALLELIGLWAVASAEYLARASEGAGCRLEAFVVCAIVVGVTAVPGAALLGFGSGSRGPRCCVEETGSVAFGAGVVYTGCRVQKSVDNYAGGAGGTPSGKRPVLPLVIWRPRNQPSPKSSSRSMSSMRSPFARLNSSGLRAMKSSER